MNEQRGHDDGRGWMVWVYCVVLVAGGLAQMLRKVLTDTGGFGSRYAALLLAVLVSIGVLARVRRRALGSPWIWRALLGLLGLVVLALMGFSIQGVLDQSWSLVGLCLGGVALLAPAGIWLWDYSYRSEDLWAGSRDAS